MKTLTVVIVSSFLFAFSAQADVYMQMPRGSNNKLTQQDPPPPPPPTTSTVKTVVNWLLSLV